MAKYKDCFYEQTLMIPVSFEKQILPGIFEYALCHLFDERIDLPISASRYENVCTGAPAYDPAILLKIISVCRRANRLIILKSNLYIKRCHFAYMESMEWLS